MKRKIRTYSGQKDTSVSERETKNRALSRRAASEGIVLLENNGILPIDPSCSLFLAGNGAVHPIKGGTGSGDVNVRDIVDLLSGVKNAGFSVINEADINDCINDYNEAREEYGKAVKDRLSKLSSDNDSDFFKAVFEIKQRPMKRITIDKEQAEKADAVIYMISRIAGEGSDRNEEKGDYYPDEDEISELSTLSECTDKIIVLINTGGQIDLKDIKGHSKVAALLNVSQGGQELGNAIADVLTGKVTPGGKLSSTWAVNYKDFPGSENFSHNNGDLENEFYTDGIYVGYRYFESFGINVEYPFGYGLSYTSFSLSDQKLEVNGGNITVEVTVKNTGDRFSGREVVQVYSAAPQTSIKKEFKKLTGFKKTGLLKPGESETLKITFTSKDIAVFDEESGGFIVEKGQYGIFAGNSSADAHIIGVLQVNDTAVIEHTDHILPLQDQVDEIERPDAVIEKLTQKWKEEAKNLTPAVFVPAKEEKAKEGRRDLDDAAWKTAEKLTDEELTALLMGEITKGQEGMRDGVLIETGIYVPGAAGETTNILEEKYDVSSISLADGPAGIRLQKFYDVDKASGNIYSQGFFASIEGGLFANRIEYENADTYYMFPTSIPTGTCLAQTFDTGLLAEVGKMVGGEMEEFGISWWLAPGMNIHRNPLCGRNFEYYSEDPLLTGRMAAAITNGVQSVKGVGTTIKHFACNNQEDNRMGVSSNLSERALREIYLRGFEIAVKESQPMCIMTSYNLINHIHTANSYDLCTVVARQEWGFEGIIMTDWTTTSAGGSSPHVCAIAGNDLIMPGKKSDVEDILKSLKDGSLPRYTARKCAARLIKTLFQTLGMEDVPAYKDQFGF